MNLREKLIVSNTFVTTHGAASVRNSGATGMKNAWRRELFIERVKHVHAVVYIAERANGAYPSAVDAWIHPSGCFGRLGTLNVR